MYKVAADPPLCLYVNAEIDEPKTRSKIQTQTCGDGQRFALHMTSRSSMAGRREPEVDGDLSHSQEIATASQFTQ